MKTTHTTTRLHYSNDTASEHGDTLVIEAPLDMRLVAGQAHAVAQRFAVTLRTPGDDAALVIGYLFAEGIIQSADDCDITQSRDDQILVTLKPWINHSEQQLARGSMIYSGCGLCGKTFIEAVNHMQGKDRGITPVAFNADWLRYFDRAIAGRQSLFDRTGGSHAAAMFDLHGKLIYIAEDIGRHNALDKVIGKALLAGGETAGNVLWISGRAGFELVQKAIMARAAMLVAVGAPSSLGVELAEEANLTLVAFARNGRANVYHQDADI